MNIYDFYKTDYKISFINILRQNWKETKKWSCIGSPKKDTIFIYLDGCSTKYITKDGKCYVGHSGDTLFVPKGMEYTAEFFDFKNQNSSTVNVTFELFDADGNEAFFNEITVFSSSEVRMRISELEHMYPSYENIPTKLSIPVYNIFNSMCEESNLTIVNDSFEIIRSGVEYLHYHFKEDVKIEELAEKCNVSEVYFRKLFKRHMGYSPVEYKNLLRLELACEYLKYSVSSVAEISDMLGFIDTAYFIKSFKQRYGITPLNYRKQSD